MRLILLGAPGAGKGTQAGIISHRCGIPVIATGTILRAAVKEGTELGKAAQEIIAKGELVPDAIIINLVKERLQSDDCANGYILDGMPRTGPQAEALAAQGVEIDYALSLELPDEILKERIVGRRTCNDCSSTFHVSYNPPETEGICDHCGGKLEQRQDDLPETVSKRLALFHETTEPLKDYYAKQGKLVVVNSQQELSDTTRLVFEALGIADASGQ